MGRECVGWTFPGNSLHGLRGIRSSVESWGTAQIPSGQVTKGGRFDRATLRSTRPCPGYTLETGYYETLVTEVGASESTHRRRTMKWEDPPLLLPVWGSRGVADVRVYRLCKLWINIVKRVFTNNIYSKRIIYLYN